MIDLGNGWQLYVRRTRRQRVPAKVRIQAAGMITLAPSVAEIVGTHVFVQYNAATRRIGLKTATAKDAGALKLTDPGTKAKTKRLNIASFFRQVGIDPKEVAGPYDYTLGNEMLVIQLPPEPKPEPTAAA